MSELKGRKAASHDRILEAASSALRRYGFKGVRIADVMKEAGLTHGGFYAHFSSRDELLAEAVARASEEATKRLTSSIQPFKRTDLSRFRELLSICLADGVAAKRDSGCVVAVLCASAPDQSAVVIDASRQAVADLQKVVMGALPQGHASSVAWTITAALTGAIQLAATLGDNPTGRAFLAAARSELLEQAAGAWPPTSARAKHALA